MSSIENKSVVVEEEDLIQRIVLTSGLSEMNDPSTTRLLDVPTLFSIEF
jgi:hypothetical protein